MRRSSCVFLLPGRVAGDCTVAGGTGGGGFALSGLTRESLTELRLQEGDYGPSQAAAAFARHLLGQNTEATEELGYRGRRRIHNLKYYTWVEQRGKTVQELDALWYGDEFDQVHGQTGEIDRLIEEFNAAVLRG